MDEIAKLTPEESERVRAMSLAFQQEFATKKHERKTIEDVQELKEDALEVLKHILKFSRSETLRAKVATWAYDRILDIEAKDKDDALTDLIKNMPKTEGAKSA
jgi:hypothetical protein